MLRHNFFNIFAFITSFFITNYQWCSQDIVTVNVWVHGTNVPPDWLLMHEKSPLRPWLYVERGLSLACKLPEHYYFHKFAKDCDRSDCVEFPAQHFYTFGWPSSIPSAVTRYKEGLNLADQIDRLLYEYHEQGLDVKLRVLGFSHGGNVVLNMLTCLPFTYQPVSLEIVLLGTPVQEITRRNINNMYVTRAYSFYSEGDWIQATDPQRLTSWKRDVPWFSEQRFHNDDEIIQVNLKVAGVAIGHRQYRAINYLLPCILKAVDRQLDEGQVSGNFVLDFITAT